MDEYNYTGNKTKNYFTAYLQEFVRGKRRSYLKKKESICNMEETLDENVQIGFSITVEESLEMSRREELLLKERKGTYPDWNELSDQRLISALMLLRDEERWLIYQRVFEERTFEEIGYLNNLPNERVKGIYYYAVRKIRKWMGGEN